MPMHNDTLFSLLLYRILTDKKAHCYAETWWSGNIVDVSTLYITLAELSQFGVAIDYAIDEPPQTKVQSLLAQQRSARAGEEHQRCLQTTWD